MNEKLRGLEHRPSGDPKEPDSKLVEVLLGDKASQAFKAMGGDGEAPPTGDAGNAVDLTKISPEALTTLEAESSLDIWGFKGMVRWVEEELQEAEGINDPEAWVNEHCDFVDGKILTKKTDWFLNKVTTLSKFPPVEGLQWLWLNSLKNADGLTVPEGLEKLLLNSLESADGLVLPEGLKRLSLDRLKSADGLVLPEGLQVLSLSLKSADGLTLPEGLQVLSINSLVSADGLTLPEGLKKLFLSSLVKADGLTVPEGLEKLSLKSLQIIDGIIAPDNMSGTQVVLSTSSPQPVRDFFEDRGADVVIW